MFIRVTLSKMHVPLEIKMPKLQRDLLFERLSTEGKQLPNRFFLLISPQSLSYLKPVGGKVDIYCVNLQLETEENYVDMFLYLL